MTVPVDAPAAFVPVLARLQADVGARFGAPVVQFDVAAYQDRPFSQLLRIRVWGEGRDRPLTHLFVKLTKPTALNGDREKLRQRVARDFETTCRVHASMAAHGDLGTVPPVACYPEHLAIVTEEVVGQTLLDHLRNAAAWFPTEERLGHLADDMRRVGRWLRAFQQTEPRAGRVSLDELRAYIDHRLQRLANAPGSRFTAQSRRDVLCCVDALSREVPADELREVPIHADLAPGNILIAGGRVVVLDFAMSRRGSFLHDLTRLALQIEMLGVKPYFKRAVLARLTAALIDGYGESVTVEGPLFRLLTLLHRVNQLTGLTINSAPTPAAVYNGFVRRHHRRRIADEVRLASVAAVAP